MMIMLSAEGKPRTEAGASNSVRRPSASPDKRHPRFSPQPASFLRFEDETKDYWFAEGQARLQEQLQQKIINNQAKNIILFLGDGMSMTTITAARIYKGQLEGQRGEDFRLEMEKFPFSAYSKTYSVDNQVPDSACSATAYMGGAKTNYGVVGLDGRATRFNCPDQLNKTLYVDSILKLAQDAGKGNGFVTTTRVTHATPAGTFAHTVERFWEDNQEVENDGEDSVICDDVAEMLIEREPGKNIQVILGGGRARFTPDTVMDVEDGSPGFRTDGKDLIETWMQDKQSRNLSHSYVWTRDQVLDLNTDNTDYIMGLFAPDHMDMFLNSSDADDPTLSEMLSVAINRLKREENGFFLLVEGGLIDTAHHDTTARHALHETVEFDNAISLALNMTDRQDTLIIVTADHGHTMNFNGYAPRGYDILGIAEYSDVDGLPYLTLMYGNGEGYHEPNPDGSRYDISNDPVTDKDYMHIAATPRESESHDGTDVAIFAWGPQAHLFSGVYEQTYIAHVMAYAACLGDGITFCNNK